MGITKDGYIRWQELVAQMEDLAVEAGSMSRNCPHETLIDEYDQEPAYQLAEERFKSNKLPGFESLDEVKKALSEAFDNAGMECGACEKVKDD